MSTSYGLNRLTGKPMTGWEHTVQSLIVIYSTAYEVRVQRPHVGSRVPKMLGLPLTSTTVLGMITAMIEATELFEPRFKIIRITPKDNSGDTLRRGEFSLNIEGIYRPLAHKGDFTPDYQLPKRTITLYSTTNGFVD